MTMRNIYFKIRMTYFLEKIFCNDGSRYAVGVIIGKDSDSLTFFDRRIEAFDSFFHIFEKKRVVRLRIVIGIEKFFPVVRGFYSSFSRRRSTSPTESISIDLRTESRVDCRFDRGIRLGTNEKLCADNHCRRAVHSKRIAFRLVSLDFIFVRCCL